MGLEVKKIELSKEDQELIEKAKLRAKELRESGCGEEFDEEITEEDYEELRKFLNKDKK